MKVQILIALKADFPLPVLLQVAGLARSTFFYHQARIQAPDPQGAIKAAVTEIFEKNHGRYGHRRVHTEMVKQGWTVAKKTVLKLMRFLRLVCKVRRKKRYNSYQGGQGRVAPNVLNREFETDAPNRKWVTDVTEFSVGDRKLYLSPVMDLFDRQIISYTISSSPNLELTNTSLRQALACLEHGQQPLVHSDQGFQDGFNRSSQHLDSGGNHGQTGRLDEGVHGQACHEIAREAFITAGHRAGVLARDRDGMYERGGGDSGWRVAGGWNALVPGSWRHADVYGCPAQRPVSFV